jgi:hypothetical protein
MRAGGKSEILDAGMAVCQTAAIVFFLIQGMPDMGDEKKNSDDRLVRTRPRLKKILLPRCLVTLVHGSHAPASIIFFLTSLFIDSIHSISCN